MEGEIENQDEQVGGIPVRSEQVGFRPDEMVGCVNCGKANPPNRFKCLYCASDLALVTQLADTVALKLRRLEAWENGQNIVLISNDAQPSEDETEKICRSLDLDFGLVLNALGSVGSTPLLRVESDGEARAVKTRLESQGFSIAIISDEELHAETPPVRLRELEFEDGKLLAFPFNTQEIIEISTDQIAVIVTGAIIEEKSEVTLKRKKSESKTIDELQTASDLAVVDFHVKNLSNGFRIPARGFDFSCLGEDKGLIAADNLAKLSNRLREFSRNAIFVDDYLSKKRGLDTVWEPERRNESKGIQRAGFGQLAFSTGSTTSNVQQFTKYSRLQMRLI